MMNTWTIPNSRITTNKMNFQALRQTIARSAAESNSSVATSMIRREVSSVGA